jgi:hypothetical protein
MPDYERSLDGTSIQLSDEVGMYHGMHAEFVAYRSDSSVSGHFNVLNSNFFPTVPLNAENMPPMNPSNLYSDGSQYNPDDPFNPEAEV